MREARREGSALIAGGDDPEQPLNVSFMAQLLDRKKKLHREVQRVDLLHERPEKVRPEYHRPAVAKRKPDVPRRPSSKSTPLNAWTTSGNA
jgi:hypothetical protein